ncbi:MAG TPA: membrane protein insertase YidC [Candidatus Saccharimonadales bacterium]|nr:membrane protein insertase YidC [Candidatus Saccharimonadales bacterium]
MDDRRLLLAIALAALILLGWQLLLNKSGLDRRFAPPPPSPTSAAAPVPSPAATSAAAATAAPAAGAAAALAPSAPGSVSALSSAAPESLISVDTEHWKVVFSSRGARPVNWVLKSYRRGDRLPLDLVPPGAGLETLALRRGVSVVDFTGTNFQVVEDRQDSTGRVLGFQARETNGATFTVRYHLPRSGQLVTVGYEVSDAQSEDRVVVQWRTWRFDTEANPAEDLRQARVATLLGEELAQDRLGAFKKNPEKDRPGNVEWTCLRSKYFAVGFLFPTGALGGVVALGNPDSLQLGVRFEYPLLGRKAAEYEMYVGPVDFWQLKPLGHNLIRLADSGWKIMAPLNQAMLTFFTWTHKFVPNYGLVIIVLSVVMRLVFWPLNHSQMRNMRKMQELQPVMERLREKYKSDQERLNRETFQLYKDHNVNPLGGCLPILFQMPVFFALYNVLSSSIDLRQAGFIAWIRDLSAPDVLYSSGGFSLHVLPLIMAATMIWQQKLTPMDPRQALTGYLMPVVMLFIFYSMPSGLVLYWTVTNILTVLQQMQQIRGQQKPAEAVAS